MESFSSIKFIPLLALLSALFPSALLADNLCSLNFIENSPFAYNLPTLNHTPNKVDDIHYTDGGFKKHRLGSMRHLEEGIHVVLVTANYDVLTMPKFALNSRGELKLGSHYLLHKWWQKESQQRSVKIIAAGEIHIIHERVNLINNRSSNFMGGPQAIRMVWDLLKAFGLPIENRTRFLDFSADPEAMKWSHSDSSNSRNLEILEFFRLAKANGKWDITFKKLQLIYRVLQREFPDVDSPGKIDAEAFEKFFDEIINRENDVEFTSILQLGILQKFLNTELFVWTVGKYANGNIAEKIYIAAASVLFKQGWISSEEADFLADIK